MVRVKICGLTDIQQVSAAVEAGADYLGLVFAPSRRQIGPEIAIEIARELNRKGSRPLLVGIFVNSPAEEVNLLAERCYLDWVQLSGTEDWEYCQSIVKPVIKAIHVSPQATSSEIIGHLEKGYRLVPRERLIGLLDTQAQSAFGGTGQTFNWQLAKEVADVYPIIVAGGLTPNNVGHLISTVKPWGVDVSSGVETAGRKDIQKIKEFISRVKSYSDGSK